AFFCASDGADFCDEDGAWPVVAFGSDFCAAPELSPLLEDDWLPDGDDVDDELRADFTLILPSNPRALTVRVSMRPFASKPLLRWKLVTATRVLVSNTPGTRRSRTLSRMRTV